MSACVHVCVCLHVEYNCGSKATPHCWMTIVAGRAAAQLTVHRVCRNQKVWCVWCTMICSHDNDVGGEFRVCFCGVCLC